MYLGVLLIFIASGLIYHSVSLLILSLLLFSLAHLVVVFFEEPALRNKFGESYTAYEDAVGRWFPKVKK
jgi:protein-S-isoprenylcysteine O-methyltransferase Ste14